MPKPNAIVSSVIRFEHPLDRPPAELLRARRDLSVELEGGRKVRLVADDPRAAGFAAILNELSKLGLPVYLETDPATSVVTLLLIPLVTRVISIRSIDSEMLGVELERSHARHILRRSNADFGDLERQLRQALSERAPIILTENDAHEIIDVRPYPPQGPRPPFPKPEYRPRPLPWWKRLIAKWRDWRLWFCCMSRTRAQQVFEAMNGTSCDPLTVPAPCIPFLYPDDGCWGRAHEMCRLMINMGLSPRKVWIEGWLHVSTRNNPNCEVYWGWHVAPTLCVRAAGWLGLFLSRQMVIDPSLFATPVTRAAWKSVQGDPSATLTPSNASTFLLWGGVTDPTYAETNGVLAYYRLQLQNRAIQHGAPPYAQCP